MNLKDLIQEIYLETERIDNDGQLASYIPELSTID